MATKQTLEAQLLKLNATIETERGRYRAAVSAAIDAVLGEYGLTLADLTSETTQENAAKAKFVKEANAEKAKGPKGIKTKSNGATRKKYVRVPKYKDPASDATWSGMGHAPHWIKDAKNRDKFLIAQPAAE
jgi:DNA-binding protein H-NS